MHASPASSPVPPLDPNKDRLDTWMRQLVFGAKQEFTQSMSKDTLTRLRGRVEATRQAMKWVDADAVWWRWTCMGLAVLVWLAGAFIVTGWPVWQNPVPSGHPSFGLVLCLWTGACAIWGYSFWGAGGTLMYHLGFAPRMLEDALKPVALMPGAKAEVFRLCAQSSKCATYCQEVLGAGRPLFLFDLRVLMRLAREESISTTALNYQRNIEQLFST